MGTNMSVKNKRKNKAGKSASKSAGKKVWMATPTKGGDGGVAVPIKRGPHWNDNAKVVLTGSSINGPTKIKHRAFIDFVDQCIPTTDRHDRAHAEKRLIHLSMPETHEDSFTAPTLQDLGPKERKRGLGQARRYHRSQIVGRIDPDTGVDNRVGIDSMYDQWADTASKLESAGIEMGCHLSSPGQTSILERELRRKYEGEQITRDEFRNRIQQKTSIEMTPEEISQHRKGSDWLTKHASETFVDECD